MSIFRKRRAQNLDEWLEIATEGLAPAAKERIWADIASHYDEAVAGHLDNALPMSAAQTGALAELGDAKIAARRFRRAHLTKYEFQQVAKLLKSARRYGRYGLAQAGDLAFCWFFCSVNPAAELLVPGFHILRNVAIALIIVCSITDFVLARRKSADPFPRMLVLMQSLRCLTFGMLMLTGISLQELHVMPFLMTSLVLFGYSLFYFGLRNKLGKVAEDWVGEAGQGRHEIPPDKPVAS
jgi:hypothetical protein